MEDLATSVTTTASPPKDTKLIKLNLAGPVVSILQALIFSPANTMRLNRISLSAIGEDGVIYIYSFAARRTELKLNSSQEEPAMLIPDAI